jgi:hypothetical protein
MLKITKILLAGVVMLSASTAHATKITPTCAMVATDEGDLENSSKFFNVRLRPDIKSKVMGKIKAGDVIYIDVEPTLDLFKDWIHMSSGVDSYLARGWVARKYLKIIDCPSDEPFLPPLQINTIPVPQ